MAAHNQRSKTEKYLLFYKRKRDPGDLHEDLLISINLRSAKPLVLPSFLHLQVNILEATADALYSNAEVMIDSNLIKTLLHHDAKDANVTMGISIAGSVMNNCLPAGVANQLLLAH